MQNQQKKQKKKNPPLKLSKQEESFFQNGFKHIVGIDEVGRGCYAGSMVVCGFVIDIEHSCFDDINDSKLLTRPEREKLYPTLTQCEHTIFEISCEDIDNLGLTLTFKNAISEIHRKYFSKETIFLIDGNMKFELENAHSIIDGDAQIYSIACASIIAKVFRDNLMIELGKKYPEYGFESHVGYGTKQHIEAIKKYGLLDIHRKLFKPIQKLKAQSLKPNPSTIRYPIGYLRAQGDKLD